MKFTIVIPELDHPLFLEWCMEGILKNSVYEHDIIIVYSNPEGAELERREISYFHTYGQLPYGKNLENDEEVIKNYKIAINKTELDRYTPSTELYKHSNDYKNIRELFEGRPDLFKRNNVRLVDVSKEREELKQKVIAGGKPENFYHGGIDTAFKDNIGISMAKTEWVMPNFDDDFYPSPRWDEELTKYVNNKYNCYIPTHIQPQIFSRPPPWKDKFYDCREYACHRVTMPMTPDYKFIVHEKEFLEFCKEIYHNSSLWENSGIRNLLHWVPVLYHRDILKMAGPKSLMGSGYDLIFDSHMGELGVGKVSSRSSFILHKGMVLPDKNIDKSFRYE